MDTTPHLVTVEKAIKDIGTEPPYSVQFSAGYAFGLIAAYRESGVFTFDQADEFRRQTIEAQRAALQQQNVLTNDRG